jgi:hypothetical protein
MDTSCQIIFKAENVTKVDSHPSKKRGGGGENMYETACENLMFSAHGNT